jgi:hypothetical protein
MSDTFSITLSTSPISLELRATFEVLQFALNGACAHLDAAFAFCILYRMLPTLQIVRGTRHLNERRAKAQDVEVWGRGCLAVWVLPLFRK